jgi:hypothetical protein
MNLLRQSDYFQSSNAKYDCANDAYRRDPENTILSCISTSILNRSSCTINQTQSSFTPYRLQTQSIRVTHLFLATLTGYEATKYPSRLRVKDKMLLEPNETASHWAEITPKENPNSWLGERSYYLTINRFTAYYLSCSVPLRHVQQTSTCYK